MTEEPLPPGLQLAQPSRAAAEDIPTKSNLETRPSEDGLVHLDKLQSLKKSFQKSGPQECVKLLPPL